MAIGCASHLPGHIAGGLTGFVSNIGFHMKVHVWPSINEHSLDERQRSNVIYDHVLPATSIAKHRSSIAARTNFAFSIAKFTSLRLIVSTKQLWLKIRQYLYKMLSACHAFSIFLLVGRKTCTVSLHYEALECFSITFFFLFINTVRSALRQKNIRLTVYFEARERERK